MKLNKYYVFKITFYAIIITILIGCIYNISKFPKDEPIIITMLFIVIVLLVCFTVLGFIEYFRGSRYITKHKIPIERFEVLPYKNVTVIAYKNNAYAIPHHHKHLLDREWIPGTEYFNRKEENLGYSIDLPYLRKVA